MLNLKPVREIEATAEIAKLYLSIKQTLGLQSVPLIFQFLAGFPTYFSYIWQQIEKNLHDHYFQRQITEIQNFAQTAIDEIYSPSAISQLIITKMKESPELLELSKFVSLSTTISSYLYLVSLALRESLKGTHFGIKQIGENLSNREKIIFSDLSEGFENVSPTNPEDKQILLQNKSQLTKTKVGSLTTSYTNRFFEAITWEMERLIKKENYLIRRVELERFALARLPLMPHPFESSFANIVKQTAGSILYPELIYLIYELFPTQAPYKLFACQVMKKTILWQPQEANKTSSSPILLPSPSD